MKRKCEFSVIPLISGLNNIMGVSLDNGLPSVDFSRWTKESINILDPMLVGHLA